MPFPAGVFYLSYVLFQVPSNIIMMRLDNPPLWLGSIVCCWGLVAACFATVDSKASFLTMRILLGVAESGAYPAMWSIISQFYPPEQSTFAFSTLEATIAASQVVAAPLAAGLMQLDGTLGLEGWKWIFIAEGIPTMLLGAAIWLYLPRSPSSAWFLRPEERDWLQQESAAQSAAAAALVANKSPSLSHDAEGSCAQPFSGSSGGRALDDQQHAAAADTSGRWPRSGVAEERHPLFAGGSELRSSPVPIERKTSASMGGAAAGGQRGNVLAALQETLTSRAIWYLCTIKFTKDIALDGLLYWVPVMVSAVMAPPQGEASAQPSSSTSTNSSISTSIGANPDHGAVSGCASEQSSTGTILITMAPFAVAAIATVILGHTSEKFQERRLHISVPLLIGGAIFMLTPLLAPSLSLVTLTVALVAADATTGAFWSWVRAATQEVHATAVSFAFVNSMGKVGGFVGPYVFGILVQHTQSFAAAVMMIASSMLGAGGLAFFYKHRLCSSLFDRPSAGLYAKAASDEVELSGGFKPNHL